MEECRVSFYLGMMDHAEKIGNCLNPNQLQQLAAYLEREPQTPEDQEQIFAQVKSVLVESGINLSAYFSPQTRLTKVTPLFPSDTQQKHSSEDEEAVSKMKQKQNQARRPSNQEKIAQRGACIAFAQLIDNKD